MHTGIYEQLINTVIAKHLRDLPDGAFHVHKTPLDKQEAARYLSQYLAGTIHYALNEVHNDHRPQKMFYPGDYKEVTSLSKNGNVFWQ
jgi:hypothetical protein